jgi:sulfotransferase family protein
MRSPLDRVRRGAPGPPDFIGVGALGAGTGWWHGLLLAHPEITSPRSGRRALHYFDRFCAAEMTDADVAAYHGLFARRRGTITGEWTGRYMFDAWTPPLLARAAPDAKLLVLLADPIARYRSILGVRLARRKDDDEVVYMADVVDRRSHASQLARLHRFFDPERVLVLQYERCRRDPLGQYRRTLEFLGVRDRDFAPRRMRRKAAGKPASLPVAAALRLGLPAGTRRRVLARLGRVDDRDAVALWPDVEASLHTALDPEVEALAATVPGFDVTLWPNFAHLAAVRT